MERKIPNAQEAFLTNRRNFASIVNQVCFNGRPTLHSDQLEMVEDEIISADAMLTIWPSYVRSVVMHSPRGDIKIIQLGPKL